MNLTRLIFRNLWFYRKPYLAVAVGVMISTAVLTGALIVGDSVRFSLQHLTDVRLGKIRYVLQPNERFFRQELADEIFAQTHIPVAPAIQCGAIAINSDKNLRINHVQVIGIDQRFLGFWDQPLPAPGEDEAILGRNVAEKLDIKSGDYLLLRIQKQGKTPSNAPFAAEKRSSVSLRVKVAGIADDHQMGLFSLKSNQTAPFNIFISLGQMASMLELKGYANMLLAGGDSLSPVIFSGFDSAIGLSWKPEDAGLHFSKHGKDGMYEIIPDRIFFDDNTANAILSTIPGCESILTYMVNSISSKGRTTPYSFVTAANESFLKQTIAPGGIVVNEWLSKDIGIGPGDSVTLRYFIMGNLRSLKEDSARFFVKAVIPDRNSLADPQLMPDFPGMSDAGNCHDWETGAPIDLKRIRDKDEQYWKDYRGTPKAFILLETGQKIWSNKFGHFTSFRFMTTETHLPGIKKRLMEKLRPGQYGLSFQAVYKEGQLAAGNSTDFGGLFLSLSFFIMLSAVLLTAMLFSLFAQKRSAETGILAATGFRRRQILGMMSVEALIVAVAGAIPGTFAGILYNQLLIVGLNTLWYDAVNTSMIVMHIKPLAVIFGAASGILTSVTVMVVVLWKNLRNPLAILVKGAFHIPHPASLKGNIIINAATGVASIAISLILILGLLITGQTMNVPLFLAAGGLFLLGGLAMMNLFLIRTTLKRSAGITRFFQLVLKNVALHRNRTLAVVTLLSLGTFSIVITGANRKTFYGVETDRSSGTGGFLFWAETVIPIMNDLNTPAGADAYGLKDEDILDSVHFIQLTRLDGDDASCLNLNQVSRPVILGVPPCFFDRIQAFSFTGLLPSVDKGHPWKYLEKRLAQDVIPGFADETVITWGLRKKAGDTLFYRDESGKILKIKLMGGLDNSIFQGNVLVSDSLLHLFFPSSGGSRIMLIEGPASKSDAIAHRLEALFRDDGMMITSTAVRLAAFHAVENTYLSVFLLLGGLGVIIGTFGLGIVILRNIHQRRQEFAIYLALGFKRKFILRLILVEHLFMLLSGLFLGLISALTGILPSLVSPGYTVPGLFISGLILLVFISGLLWIWFPARAAMNKDILLGLRDE